MRSYARMTLEVSIYTIRYSERLADAGIEASVGSVGSAYDNALAETINGLYKTRSVEESCSCRIRDARMGSLFQHDSII
jgi:hypothetical protein